MRTEVIGNKVTGSDQPKGTASGKIQIDRRLYHASEENTQVCGRESLQGGGKVGGNDSS